MFCSLGNGITVCDRNKEVNGDYQRVAHIDSNRNVQYYVRVTEEASIEIERYAKTENPSISATQKGGVFNNER
ncbi:MAG: hypothetical protein WC123_05070 [Bacilli bacterium]